MAVPAVMPDTRPVPEPTVSIEDEPGLLQIPPAKPSLKVVELATQVLKVPVMDGGTGFTK
jgi:hypothetical protein